MEIGGGTNLSSQIAETQDEDRLVTVLTLIGRYVCGRSTASAAGEQVCLLDFTKHAKIQWRITGLSAFS